MRDDREVTVIESEGGSGLKWFLLGAAIGAGLGLLFAPQSGERTRRDLARRGRKLRAQAEDTIETLGDEVRTRGRKLKQRADEFIDNLDDDVDDDATPTIERSVPTAREEMERRLADARARARAAVGAESVAGDDDELE